MEDKLEQKPLVRVLIVDDSKAVRTMVHRWLLAEPSIRVVGEAEDGYQAITASKVYDPDVIILDVEMPGISGIEALRKIRTHDPDKTVIMFSATTQKGASATIEALSMGASDYVTKPTSERGSDNGVDATRVDLVSKILALGSRKKRPKFPSPVARYGAPPVPVPLERSIGKDAKVVGVRTSLVAKTKVIHGDPQQKDMKTRDKATMMSPSGASGLRSALRPSTLKAEAVVIASSTGGPAALSEVIPKLPSDLKVPVLIVQHMPPLFAEMLAERLDGRSPLEVKIAEEAEPVRPGVIYIAPGGRHLEVERRGAHSTHCRLSDGPPEQSCRPSANVLFRSAALVWKQQLLGVVLTGMGADGCDGSRVIVANGGSVIVQDEPTSVIWGMPGAVAKAGVASAQIPLEQVAQEIRLRVKNSGHVYDASSSDE